MTKTTVEIDTTVTWCDHCDKRATHITAIWMLCDDCLAEWREGMKAQAAAQAAARCSGCDTELVEDISGAMICPVCDADDEREWEESA